MPQVSGVGTATPTSVVPASSTLRIHVAGAVKKPGVYSLSSADRVVDAVRAAGGATSAADLEGINLAQTLVDTEQVYIPTRASRKSKVTVAPRHKPTRSSTPTTLASAASPSGTTTSRVNLNTATAAELDALPGVGPSTAQAIISHRTQKGVFSKVEDLLNVAGIGPSKLAALRDQVVV